MSSVVEREKQHKERGWGAFSPFSPLLLLVGSAALVVALPLGMLLALFLSSFFSVTNISKIGSVLSALSPATMYLALIGALVMVQILVMRLDEVAALIVIFAHLYLDWYFNMSVVALLGTLLLLLIFFLGRSPQRPWAEPRALWLWGLYLLLALLPAMKGGELNLYDAMFYYPNLILGAFIMFWLGITVARSAASVRRLLNLFALLGAFIAVHTIIQDLTGISLFSSPHVDTYLGLVSGYELGANSGVYRVGSFFVDPNWNAVFLAMMVCVSLGLLFSASSVLGRIFYLFELLLILLALLFTYSAGGWLAAGAGIFSLTFFTGRTRDRLLLPGILLSAVLVVVVFLPAQVSLLLQHGTDPNELSLRSGAWQTAVQVILANPLTGIGFGLTAYYQRAEPYRSPAQYVPLTHPHNSYLEIGAMGGIPVLLLFLALLAFTLWLAIRNWQQADGRMRPALGGGIAAIIALSVNSISINGWTLPPLAAIGWFLLGILSSPLLMTEQQEKQAMEKKDLHVCAERSV